MLWIVLKTYWNVLKSRFVISSCPWTEETIVSYLPAKLLLELVFWSSLKQFKQQASLSSELSSDEQLGVVWTGFSFLPYSRIQTMFSHSFISTFDTEFLADQPSPLWGILQPESPSFSWGRWQRLRAFSYYLAARIGPKQAEGLDQGVCGELPLTDYSP